MLSTTAVSMAPSSPHPKCIARTRRKGILGPGGVFTMNGTTEGSEWAGLENADFWATDLGSAVSNVVLRIVGQSVACASLGH